MRVKYKINNKKERVILSDVLPYEVPIIFSNRFFYKFLIENQVNLMPKTNDNSKFKLEFNSQNKFSDQVKTILELLNPSKIDNRNLDQIYSRTIPFKFSIAHKNSDYRELAIIHPMNQIFVVQFYDKYKDLIQYYAGVSEFSLRAPYKVAKLGFYNDYYHFKNFDTNSYSTRIELKNQEEEHLKSFFTYKKYSNIYKFFESHEYQECEKKFDNLYQFDIQKCFDSIYTHSLAWALLNKETVKANLSISETFANKFDVLMQNMNYGETNGILIGSEVSRIFAELLLQQVDRSVLYSLSSDKINYKKDFEIFRYVDDYFVFYNDEVVKNKIIDTYKRVLSEYKLFISESKTKEFAKPIVTSLTIAKTKISQLFIDYLAYRTISGVNDGKDIEWVLHFSSNQLITKFKIIVKESEADYKGIINYSIGTIEGIVLSAIKKFEQEEKKELYIKRVISYLQEIIDLTFFIYAVCPRVSATIKVVSLMSKLIFFVKNCAQINHAQKDSIYTKAYTEIYKIIQQNKFNPYSQNETLYLLILLTIFDKDYLLEEDMLIDYFFNDNNSSLNYFTITSLLFYIKNFKKYCNLKHEIIKKIKDKFKYNNPDLIQQNTELIILLLDLIKCPYIDIQVKRDILKEFKITEKNKQDQLIKYNKFWFIKWTNFNLIEEINLKKGFEVYS